jgi:serine/threonine-protein kinase
MSDSVTRLNTALEGRYRIESELGEGGMAIVYLADDLKHERKVALKVLKPELAAVVGAERFLAEIKTTASLQHPHILPLYDSGEADSFLFYVMPYVEGETLRERIDREGELPIQQAVRILRDLVDALGYAHSHEVVHRDVKPGNIMLSGRHASVMDFGVAKAVGESRSPGHETTVGVALGTPTYMAPEQAAAEPNVDQRADIYAVGVVGYEILTGRPPFSARTTTGILAAHVTQAPVPIGERRPTVPERLGAAIMRCLEKRASDRWQSGSELLGVLEETLAPSISMTPISTPATSRSRVTRRRVPILAAAGVVTIAGIVAWTSGLLSINNTATSIRIESSQPLTTAAEMEIHPAVSPDGRFVVYAAGTSAGMRLYLRTVDGGRTIPLTDDSTAVEEHPRWSSDGNRILFLSGGSAMTVSALGGTVTRAAGPGAEASVTTATWSPDGNEIAVARGTSLAIIPLDGGVERAVTEHPSGLTSCVWSPVSAHVTCVGGNPAYSSPGPTFGNLAPSSIVSINLEDGTTREILPPVAMNQSPVWSADGGMLFFVSNRDGIPDIYSLNLDENAEPVGQPQRITTGSNAHSFSITADSRRMAYSVYTAEANIWSLPIPVNGSVGLAGATQFTFGRQIVESVRPSPDGESLVYDSDVSGNSDIWRLPLAGGTPEQLTDDPRSDFAPDVSPSGREIAYHAFQDGSREIFVQDLESGVVTQVTAGPEYSESFPRWSPDGSSLVYYDQLPRDDRSTWLIRRDSNGTWGEPEVLITGTRLSNWSTDGQYMTSIGASIFDVDTREIRALRSEVEGESPGETYWSQDQSTLYFKTRYSGGAVEIRSISVSTGEERMLVRFDDPRRVSMRSDFSGDDERFYFTLDDRWSDVWLAEMTLVDGN